jgi:nitrite reductase/ring-hydroxylating ferredoxin subunit
MDNEVAYVICALNDIQSQKAAGFNLMVIEEGEQRPLSLVIVRWGRQVFGYVNKCPHDGVKLDWERNQFLDGNGLRLMCGKHGAMFELGTGICTEGPCKGRTLKPVALEVIDGDICATGITLVEDDDEDDDDVVVETEEELKARMEEEAKRARKEKKEREKEEREELKLQERDKERERERGLK